MFNFFRKIRQNHLSGDMSIPHESKSRSPFFTWKYFKYAIGEIILVVFGILIALQVNNWNTNRMDRIEERELLEQLQIEFLDNQNQLIAKEDLRKISISSCEKLLKIIDHSSKAINRREIDSLLSNILPFTFDPSQGIINQLTDAGKLSLINNDTLRQYLSNWSSILMQLTEEEDYNVNANHNYFRPFLYKNYSYRNVTNEMHKNGLTKKTQVFGEMKDTKLYGNSSLPVDLENLLSSLEFESILTAQLSLGIHINNQSHGVNEYIEIILKMIKRELK